MAGRGLVRHSKVWTVGMKFQHEYFARPLSGSEVRKLRIEVLDMLQRLCIYMRMKPHPRYQGVKQIIDCNRKAEFIIRWNDHNEPYLVASEQGYCRKHAEKGLARYKKKHQLELKKMKDSIQRDNERTEKFVEGFFKKSKGKK